jgi:hypothetical protein
LVQQLLTIRTFVDRHLHLEPIYLRQWSIAVSVLTSEQMGPIYRVIREYQQQSRLEPDINANRRMLDDAIRRVRTMLGDILRERDYRRINEMGERREAERQEAEGQEAEGQEAEG